MTLWDSRQRGGRPDTLKLVKDAYKSFNAEVVFITSNFQGNAELMEGCKQAGIPAFVRLISSLFLFSFYLFSATKREVAS